MSQMNIHKVMALLPHRFPFLLVDRVLVLDPGVSVEVLKNVTVNEPCFQGHFPEYPVYPGVLLLESMAQTMAFITYTEAGFEQQPDQIYFFAGIDKARFKKQVIPGDQVVIKTQLMKCSQGVAKFESVAYVDGEVACKAELMGALRDVEK
jgi:3-hydroxyacyl-[acyl-carrier-protein] dehydratase